MKRLNGPTTALLIVAACAVAGCSSPTASTDSNASGADSSGPVSIAVGDMPGTDKPEERAVFTKGLEAFQKANPDIKIKGVDAKYDVATFQAQLAGGTLPDVILVPFTDIQALIANKQAADLTQALEATKTRSLLNAQTLGVATGSNQKIYGIPQQAYSIGLWYNRALFSKAGLDPDKPPTTWEEVRAAAKSITDKTGAKGFAMPTGDNAGGWLFTATSYSFGGAIESPDGKSAALASPENEKALATLRGMAVDDQSMGKDVVLKWDPWIKDFAAGKVGMQLGAPDMYSAFVLTNGMNSADLGMAAMPQETAGRGTLGGGAVSLVKPTTSERAREAIVKWVTYYYLGRYTDKARAVEQASADKAGKLPVGLPMISPVSADTQKEYGTWIADYVNVPVQQFASYSSSPVTSTIVPEPPTKAQAVYGLMDTVLQKAFASATPATSDLLAEANTQVQTALGR